MSHFKRLNRVFYPETVFGSSKCHTILAQLCNQTDFKIATRINAKWQKFKEIFNSILESNFSNEQKTYLLITVLNDKIFQLETSKFTEEIKRFIKNCLKADYRKALKKVMKNA